jgi:hypothetical protein
MNAFPSGTTTNPSSLTVEVRLANGSSTVFHETGEQRVREALRLLAAPTLFAQPHLLVASQLSASMVPSKGIDIILARTTSPLPLKFPLILPAGEFDFVERPLLGPDDPSARHEGFGAPSVQPHRRDARLEVRTLGGWAVALEAAARLHGNAHDERQLFSLLPTIPGFPFRLGEGGFGVINTANIVHVSAYPRPAALPEHSLPLSFNAGFRRA